MIAIFCISCGKMTDTKIIHPFIAHNCHIQIKIKLGIVDINTRFLFWLVGSSRLFGSILVMAYFEWVFIVLAHVRVWHLSGFYQDRLLLRSGPSFLRSWYDLTITASNFIMLWLIWFRLSLCLDFYYLYSNIEPFLAPYTLVAGIEH